MNAIIRVIQFMLSVIIQISVATLHRCHCRAFYASLVTARAAMAPSQSRQNHQRRGVLCLISGWPITSPFYPSENFSPTFLFILFYDYFDVTSSSARDRNRASEKTPPPLSFFFYNSNCVFIASFFYSLCHAQEEFSFLPSWGAASATLLCSRSG